MDGANWRHTVTFTRQYSTTSSTRDDQPAHDQALDEIGTWCTENCKGDWKIAPWFRLSRVWHCAVLFTDDRDAVLFKLFHG